MNKARRKTLEQAYDLIGQAITIIEEVKSEEEDSLYNLPESLQESEKGEQMEENIDALDEIICELERQVDAIEELL